MDKNKNTLARQVKRLMIYIGIPLIAVSIIFIIMGINTLEERKYLREVCTEQTKGIVYDFIVTGAEGYDKEEKEHWDNRCYRPLFEYKVEGKTYTSESDFGTEKKRFELGQEVIVNYNPENHAESYVPEDEGGGGAPYMLFGLAGFLLIVYIIAFIRIFIFKVFG